MSKAEFCGPPGPTRRLLDQASGPERGNEMRTRKQNGTIVAISGRWHIRYWQRQNVGGVLQRKRCSHPLGPITTRGRKPPADIVDEAESFMGTINHCSILPERIVSFVEFVEAVYLPWVQIYKRPSTFKGYRDVWEDHLKGVTSRERAPVKNLRTFNVQQWLDVIGKEDLSRNTLKHVKSVISGIFTLAKNRGYYDGVNPAQGTTIDPDAREASETHAYDLGEIRAILNLLPEPVATAFAVASFAGLRHGELQGLRWEDYRPAEF
jgi:hypothetical protein